MDLCDPYMAPYTIPRGIIIFQGVLTKFNFLMTLPHKEKFNEGLKIRTPKHFFLVGEGQT